MWRKKPCHITVEEYTHCFESQVFESHSVFLCLCVGQLGSISQNFKAHGCESWTVQKAEHWRIDAFELQCWKRLLIVPWTVRRLNQSILKEISPEYSLEGLMLKLKLKLQYFDHLMQRTDSLEKTLMLGKIEGRRRGRQRMRWLNGITNSMDMRLQAQEVGDR